MQLTLLDWAIVAAAFAVYLAAWLLLLAGVTAASWRWLEAPLLARKERWAA